jgi:Type II secretion system (T2SS), protein G
MDLKNSKRLTYTASYVTTHLLPDEQQRIQAQPGGGPRKLNLLRVLDLQPQDIDGMRESLAASPANMHKRQVRDLFAAAEAVAAKKRSASTMTLAAALAPIPDSALLQFAKLAPGYKDNYVVKEMIGLYERRLSIHPIGRLHLERIEMYPVGVQKGELVFTVPMAPGETVTISHKEWSTSSREYEDIVQDFFESYSERGVAEKTDSSMSSESESKHSSALNFGATLSGTYAGVTLTTSLGLTNTRDDRASAKESTQRGREVTEKASARTRKEHKVSMKLEAKKGTEDNSFRTIQNPATNAVRLDYYRMMRKWRTDLFRYGLRMTYDLAIPTPGVRLWARYERLAALDKRLRTPFPFGLKAEDLNDGNWPAKAAELGVPSAVVPPPPEPLVFKAQSDVIGFFDDAEAKSADRFGKLEFDVPPGYALDDALATANISQATGGSNFTWHDGGNLNVPNTVKVTGGLLDFRPPNPPRSGKLAATFSYRGVHTAGLTLLLTFRRTPATEQAWQRAAWAAIKASAEARYQEETARLQEERDRLWAMLNGKDTLSLRRLEREELLRLIIQWLLGPDHPVVATMPVEATLQTLQENEVTFVTAPAHSSAFFIDNLPPVTAPTFAGIDETQWHNALLFGEAVKFIQQAIEWENLLYFLYPYFWGSETVGRDKMLFQHPDPEHERFLRAGYARIVITVRPGFEEAFTKLVESGSLAPDATSPYMDVATEIANFAKTNYAGIPPANPESNARPLLYPEQRATWDTMQSLMALLETFKTKNGSYPAALSELPGPPLVDAWGRPFVYSVPGLGADYDLMSLGKDGEAGGEGLDADISSAAGASLIATWYDYTPTSALDIEVDTKPEDIA